jgi:hypothetical protein
LTTQSHKFMPQKTVSSLIDRYNPNLPNRLLTDEAAKQTLDQLIQLKFSANPIHYTLIFEAINDIDPYFSNQIQTAIKNNTYGDDAAETLYIELISHHIHSLIQSEEVEDLINELLQEIENWINNTQSQQSIITNEIELVSQEPQALSVTTRLKETVLPRINELFENTGQLRMFWSTPTGHFS